MQTSTPNYFDPNQGEDHSSRNVFIWILIVLVIFGVGYFVYKKYGKEKYSFEEKMEILDSVGSGQDTITKEEKEKVLEEMNSSKEEVYSEDQKLDILNNL